MIRGLYIAGTGMNVQTKRLDVISNDLANVNTTGYKKDEAVVSSFNEVLTYRMKDMENNVPNNGAIGTMNFGARIDEIYTQFAQGSLIKTDGLVDVALQGDGFFAVETPEGVAYTRDGKFSINSEGNLVTKEGYAVLGENGPIEIGEDYLNNGGKLTIGEKGEITLDGQLIDTLELVKFADNRALTKREDNLYIGNGQGDTFEGTVIQGYTESSNVNPVTAMVDMITVSRAYEANQKMIQVHDTLLGKAVNEVGRA
nr:flagellar basal-body rod protein FlgF [uncultured Niameybacter sp.]